MLVYLLVSNSTTSYALKANKDFSGTAEAVLVSTFRFLLEYIETAIRIKENYYLDPIVAYKVARKEKVPERTNRPSINVEHLPPALLGALEDQAY